MRQGQHISVRRVEVPCDHRNTERPIRVYFLKLKQKLVMSMPETGCPEWDGERMCDDCMEWYATK